MNEIEIRAVLEASLFADRTDEIMNLAAPTLRLVRSGATPDDLPPGASRLGGVPDLPPGIAWPVDNGRPLDFIAQIDLAEAAAATRLPDMPAMGRLAFFYDADNQPWGFDPKDQGGWRVLFFEDAAASLRRVMPPDPIAPSRPPPAPGLLARLLGRHAPAARPAEPLTPYKAHAFRYVAETTLPNLFDEIDVDFDDKDRWYNLGEIVSKLDAEFDSPDHRFGGHPSQIQGDMKLECQLASNGLYCGDGDAYDSERGLALKAGKDDWQLLLQIDSDTDGPGWMWGDLGMIYFWIRHQDLATRDFDKVWCVLQCG